MNEYRFDEWIKNLGQAPGSRRLALRFVIGSALGAALTRLGLEAAAARCGRLGAKCERTGDCCRGTVCKRGRCRCAAGRKDCDGDKVCETDPLTDPRNCGACGTTCGVFKVCSDGRCVCEPGRTPCGISCCRPGAACCDGRCVDLSDDPDNCGACGSRCGEGQVCQGGSCCVPTGGTCSQSADCCNTEGFDACIRGTCRSILK